MKTILLVCLFAGLLSGCSSVTYRSTSREPDSNVITTREVTSRTLLVNRELGALKLGNDSLTGSKSDVSAAIELAKAVADKIK